MERCVAMLSAASAATSKMMMLTDVVYATIEDIKTISCLSCKCVL